MTYMPVTSFRRPMDAARMELVRAASDPLPDLPVNKWEVLRELGTARRRLGISDRTLVVLQALLSFFPGAELAGEMIVWPSNSAICERLNGMPSSTMRRHMGVLVEAGLIGRKDSPNGKRFRRSGDAFGFDLSPLCRRFAEICALAEDVRAEDEALSRLRRTVSLMRRDLAGLAEWGAETRPLPVWDRFSDMAALTSRALRRVLSLDDLKQLEARLLEALNEARDLLEVPGDAIPRTDELGTCAVEIEQDHQKSEEETNASESAQNTERRSRTAPPRMPVYLVLKTCPRFAEYTTEDLRHWHQFVRAAETLRPMMGISPDAWATARVAMGPETAALVLAVLLERIGEIRSPGGYLRALTAQAVDGKFSAVGLLRNLERRRNGLGSQL